MIIYNRIHNNLNQNYEFMMVVMNWQLSVFSTYKLGSNFVVPFALMKCKKGCTFLSVVNVEWFMKVDYMPLVNKKLSNWIVQYGGIF